MTHNYLYVDFELNVVRRRTANYVISKMKLDIINNLFRTKFS